MASTVEIESINAAVFTTWSDALIALLVACVNDGASVGFLRSLPVAKAAAFWRGVVDSLERGERRLLVARDRQGMLLGTAQLFLTMPENQPHRAEVVKLLVHPSARRLGVA